MYNLPACVAVWVKQVRKLYVYTLVTDGEDAGWAYEVRMTPMDVQPDTSGVDEVRLETVKDLVELDYQIRARLGLTQINPKLVLQNSIWKGFGAVTKGLSSLARHTGIHLPSVVGGAVRASGAWREYRHGHSKYKG